MRFLTEKERARYEAARELGLLDKLLEVGWGGLSSAESGAIGGHCKGKGRCPLHPHQGDDPLDPTIPDETGLVENAASGRGRKKGRTPPRESRHSR